MMFWMFRAEGLQYQGGRHWGPGVCEAASSLEATAAFRMCMSLKADQFLFCRPRISSDVLVDEILDVSNAVDTILWRAQNPDLEVHMRV
jgi:hypothetical protein